MSAIEPPAQPSVTYTTSLPRPARIGANAAIAGLWLWLYRPVFDYLAIIFSREDFRTNQIVLAGVIVLIAARARQGRVKARRGRVGLPAALLLIGALPFGEHMQTFVGYPMRVLTAAIVRDGLAAVGVGSIGVDTILVLENGVSQVDLPCSGVKSLWTGTLFLVAATWIERRRLDVHWILTALAFAGLLFTANVARVGVLVIVGQVAGWQLAAKMLHVPLGVMGFVAACAAAVALLQLGRRRAQDSRDTCDGRADNAAVALDRPMWLAPVLGVTILGMALAYTPRPHTGLTQPPPAWEFPANLVTEPMPLKPDEVEWLTRGGAESADRRRFEWRGETGPISGSMILVTSTTWRAQHRPERCLEVYGLSIDDSRTHLVAPDFPVRFVSLGDGDGHGLVSATYWFQSGDRTTDDHATRMWADLAPQRDRWVLVTVLFDEVRDPGAANVQAFYTALHEAVRRGLSSSKVGNGQFQALGFQVSGFQVSGLRFQAAAKQHRLFTTVHPRHRLLEGESEFMVPRGRSRTCWER